MVKSNRNILFLCDRNTVRSPMAAALMVASRKGAGSGQREDLVSKSDPTIESAGLNADGRVEGFACAVMLENGINIANHEPRTVNPKTLKAGMTVIALSIAAFETARKWREKAGFELEYWDLPAVPEHGSRETLLDGYRAIREAIKGHIRNRFAKP